MIKQKEWLDKNYNLISLFLLALGLVVAVFFCVQKQAYYLDEFYTITPANGNLMGVAVEPGEWNDTAPMLEEVSVQKGEQFSYRRVIGNLYNGVHPPLYYMMVHTVSSFFVDQYSKWFGLSVNIILYLITACFVRELGYVLSKKDKVVGLMSLCVFLFSPAILSGVVLIRDYISAALFLIILALFLSKSFADEKLSLLWFYLPVMFAITFGALSEFLFLPVCAVLIGLYGLYLIFIRRNLKDVLLMIGTCILSVAGTLAVFHPYFDRILHSRRGHQVLEALGLRNKKTTTKTADALAVANDTASDVAKAAQKAKKTASAIKKAKLYFNNLNKNVFGGLILIAIIIAIIAIVLIIKKRREYAELVKYCRNFSKKEKTNVKLDKLNVADKSDVKLDKLNVADKSDVKLDKLIVEEKVNFEQAEKVTDNKDNLDNMRWNMVQLFGGIILCTTCIIYFVFISKAGITAGESTNRFVYLIYGLVLVLFTVIAVCVCRYFFGKRGYMIAAAILAVMMISAYAQGQVLYLYSGETALKQWRAEHSEVPLVVVEDDGQYDARIEDYLEYDKVFFAIIEDLSTLEDETIKSAPELLVYVDRELDEEKKSIDLILDMNPVINQADLIYEDASRFDVYYMH